MIINIKIGEVERKFLIGRLDVKEALKHGEGHFKDISRAQDHPCESCGAGAVLSNLMENDEETITNENQIFFYAFVHMLKMMGRSISIETKILDIQMEDIEEHFEISCENRVVPNHIVLISSGDTVINIPVPISPERLNSALADSLESLPCPCVGCLSTFMAEKFKRIEEIKLVEAYVFAMAAVAMHIEMVFIAEEEEISIEDVFVVDLDEVAEFWTSLAAKNNEELH